MTHSETIAALAAALSAAQGQYPVIPRDRVVRIRTKAGGEYTFNYAPLDSILSALRPVLCANGLSVMQDIEDGAVSTMILHSSGEWWRGATVHVTPDEPGPKAVGSALTYAQRYSLRAALNVATDDDDDATTAAGDHMTVAPRSGASAAPHPTSVVQTAATPENPATASEGDNAGVSRKKGDAVTLVGNVQGDVTTATITVKEQPVEVAYFKIRTPEHGECYDVTAWHGAREQSMKFRDGDEVEVIGTWNYYKAVWKINANVVQESLPF